MIAGGNFEASLLLLENLWDGQLRELAQCESIAAAVPARDLLAFGDSRNPAVLAELRELIDRAHRSADHLLIDSILVRGAGGWSELTS